MTEYVCEYFLVDDGSPKEVTETSKAKDN